MARIQCTFVVAVAVIAGCGRGGPQHTFSSTDRDRAVSILARGPGRSVIDGANDFGLRLLRQLAGEDAKRNVLISPASVAIALDLTYNGASGQAKAGMARALGIEGVGLDDLNQAAKNLQALWRNADPKVELTVANSLWGRKDVTFKKDFLDRNERFYGAHLASLDFDSPNAARTINDWVSANTQGKIPTIIEGIDPAAVLYLVDAVYFKGPWKSKFDKGKTQSRPFHLSGGEAIQHPLMRQDGRFPYARGQGFQAVALPYGQGRMAMYIFLPDDGSSLERLLGNASAAKWRTWLSEMHTGEGCVTIPRFRSVFGADLKAALTDMGMGSAFRPSGDFEGVGGGSQCIGEVRHKTFVSVDEEGTEAAAATEISTDAAKPPGGPFDFVADRPFFYAIVEHDTGAILFMGVLRDPR
jgi:serpin B